MKKLLIWIVLFTPFLVCDPYPFNTDAPDSFLVFWDGDTVGLIVGAFKDSTGVYLHYDLAVVAAGPHVVTVRARNKQGDSKDSSVYAFTKSVVCTDAYK